MKKKKQNQATGESIEIKKYVEGAFVLPAVVDVHDFDKHTWLDVIQLKGEQFRENSTLIFDGQSMQVIKKMKDYPIQTELPIEGRLEIRKVRYFCNKVSNV